MRKQLEESYNLSKLTELEDALKDKRRIHHNLERENRVLVKVQKEQDEQLKMINKETEYEKKVKEL